MGNRANGRTGMGAVMGSKNLKAVAVRGTNRKAPLADAAALGKLARWGSREIPNNGDVIGLRNHGTESVLEGQHAAGGLPTFNYDAGQFDGYEAISGETMTATILTDTDTCYSCAVRCKRVVTTEFEGRPVEPGTAARSTRRRRCSGRTAASTTSPRSRWPTRSATSTASTRSARARRSPGRWTASSGAS